MQTSFEYKAYATYHYTKMYRKAKLEELSRTKRSKNSKLFLENHYTLGHSCILLYTIHTCIVGWFKNPKYIQIILNQSLSVALQAQ